MIVTLNGYVVPDDELWLYAFFNIPAICPASVRQAIADNPDGEDLVLEVNSCGGSVFAGFEIYSVLRAAKCRTVAHVQSLAASAASTMILGCQEVKISPVGQIMIHNPSVCTEGSKREHQQSIQALDSITTSILNAYVLRCGNRTTRAHLSEMMEAETWIPAQDAIEIGLADGFLFVEGEDASSLPTSLTNQISAGMRAFVNAAAAPNSAELIARYEQMVRNGADPVPGHPVMNPADCGRQEPAPPAPVPESNKDDWRRKARLAIEENRFYVRR